MEFTFTEDQRDIAETARAMLVDACTPDHLRTLLGADRSHDDERMEAITSMGLFGVLAPEEAGGLGLQPIDFVAIAEAAGYVALPEPLVETAGVAIPALAGAGGQEAWIEKATNGTPIAVCLPGSSFAIGADAAEAILLASGDEMHLIARDDLTLTRQVSFDGLRKLFAVSWTPTSATRINGDWALAADLAATFAAAQMIGLAQRGIDMAVEYAQMRTQFGKAIGTYQAVKHHLASAQVKVEFARPVVHAAAAELSMNNGNAPPVRARAAHAKIAAGAASDAALKAALQVHGAIGFTQEADLHFFLKRSVALQRAYGGQTDHMKTILSRISDGPLGVDCLFASEIAQH